MLSCSHLRELLITFIFCKDQVSSLWPIRFSSRFWNNWLSVFIKSWLCKVCFFVRRIMINWLKDLHSIMSFALSSIRRSSLWSFHSWCLVSLLMKRWRFWVVRLLKYPCVIHTWKTDLVSLSGSLCQLIIILWMSDISLSPKSIVLWINFVLISKSIDGIHHLIILKHIVSFVVRTWFCPIS